MAANNNKPHILIENVVPSVDGGRFAAKALVGEVCHVEADIFRDGNEPMQVSLEWRRGKSGRWTERAMTNDGNDRWRADFPLTEAGTYEYLFRVKAPMEEVSTVFRVVADKPLAQFGAWYEMFVRSQGTDKNKSGTFIDAEGRLNDIKEMGFDVVYLAPIHPIGRTARKGPNNSLHAGPTDPGSPWAIGNEHGGHTAIEPALGTLNDFDAFVKKAKELGLEIAVDFAPHCSPDHPWVKEHPSWFYHRADGSIQCHENPPYTYEDIYPLNFDGPDHPALFEALRDVFLFWIERGVTIFRVDNPHTKPLFFWEWVIAQVKEKHPEIIFLAEAFTRPKMKYALSKGGFSQSYTYFIWRQTKPELIAYLSELTEKERLLYFRPNFFVTTPDVLPNNLVHGGRPAMLSRLALAATLSPSYGIINGYELGENEAMQGLEEYANSEKYQVVVRDWNKPGHMKDIVRRLNQIRNENLALHAIDTLSFISVENEHVLAALKITSDKSNQLIIVVNLDAHHPQHATLQIPMDKMGFSWEADFDVEELMGGHAARWSKTVSLHLNPHTNPFQIFRVKK